MGITIWNMTYQYVTDYSPSFNPVLAPTRSHVQETPLPLPWWPSIHSYLRNNKKGPLAMMPLTLLLDTAHV